MNNNRQPHKKIIKKELNHQKYNKMNKQMVNQMIVEYFENYYYKYHQIFLNSKFD